MALVVELVLVVLELVLGLVEVVVVTLGGPFTTFDSSCLVG